MLGVAAAAAAAEFDIVVVGCGGGGGGGRGGGGVICEPDDASSGGGDTGGSSDELRFGAERKVVTISSLRVGRNRFSGDDEDAPSNSACGEALDMETDDSRSSCPRFRPCDILSSGGVRAVGCSGTDGFGGSDDSVGPFWRRCGVLATGVLATDPGLLGVSWPG